MAKKSMHNVSVICKKFYWVIIQTLLLSLYNIMCFIIWTYCENVCTLRLRRSTHFIISNYGVHVQTLSVSCSMSLIIRIYWVHVDIPCVWASPRAWWAAPSRPPCWRCPCGSRSCCSPSSSGPPPACGAPWTSRSAPHTGDKDQRANYCTII